MATMGSEDICKLCGFDRETHVLESHPTRPGVIELCPIGGGAFCELEETAVLFRKVRDSK